MQDPPYFQLSDMRYVLKQPKKKKSIPNNSIADCSISAMVYTRIDIA